MCYNRCIRENTDLASADGRDKKKQHVTMVLVQTDLLSAHHGVSADVMLPTTFPSLSSPLLSVLLRTTCSHFTFQKIKFFTEVLLITQQCQHSPFKH